MQSRLPAPQPLLLTHSTSTDRHLHKLSQRQEVLPSLIYWRSNSSNDFLMLQNGNVLVYGNEELWWQRAYLYSFCTVFNNWYIENVLLKVSETNQQTFSPVMSATKCIITSNFHDTQTDHGPVLYLHAAKCEMPLPLNAAAFTVSWL